MPGVSRLRPCIRTHIKKRPWATLACYVGRSTNINSTKLKCHFHRKMNPFLVVSKLVKNWTRLFSICKHMHLHWGYKDQWQGARQIWIPELSGTEQLCQIREFVQKEIVSFEELLGKLCGSVNITSAIRRCQRWFCNNVFNIPLIMDGILKQ